MRRATSFIRSLRFVLPSVALCCTLIPFAGAGATKQNQFSTITASGQQITSIFDGLVPNQELRNGLVLKIRPLGSPSLPKLGSPNIGQMMGVAPAANASSCPTGGICGNPGTTGTFGQFCQDNFGCGVSVHNQAPGEPNQGVRELFQCEQCCIDWSPCTINSVTGGGGCVRPICVDPNPPSPIIIDTEGEGFHLTSAEGGVMFDIAGDGHPIPIAWTAAGFRNAFLSLPGPDGLVHNGKELFGNFTPQPESANPNGFIALAQYDKPENGGNGDGIIDERDAVYSQLRLWIDENHDGICQANELHKLTELGVYSLALKYVESQRTDEFGNAFRYKAKVNVGRLHDLRDERLHGEGNEVGRWAWDVFFVSTLK